MYDEISAQGNDYQAPLGSAQQGFRYEVERRVQQVLNVENVQVDPKSPTLLVFVGQLKLPSAEAYDVLDQVLEPMNCRAHFSMDEQNEKHVIAVLRERFRPQERPWWPNAVLWGLTILCTMGAGANLEGEANILAGLPYALSVMLILGAHELGHYFAARYHNVAVTLPYFIPFPPIIGLFGTLGAFIQLREPMRNRTQLFDIGIAGPLAGLFFAIPILILGVSTAEVNTLPTREDCEADGPCGYILEGNSLFYATTKYIFHDEWLPTSTKDMTLNQLAFAGWTGLILTSINLLPVGQLDGGHILYSLFGRFAKRLYVPIVLIMALMAFNYLGWILWVLLMLVFGRIHAVPLDDITPLQGSRRVIGILTLVILFFIFVPVPITPVDLR